MDKDSIKGSETEIRRQTFITLLPLLHVTIVVYCLLALSHACFLPIAESYVMVPMAGGTALCLGVIRLICCSTEFREAWSTRFSLVVVALATLNSLTHLWLSAEVKHSTNLALVIVGTGYVLLRARSLAAILSFQLMSWLSIVVLRTPNQDILHYAFMLFLSVFLSVLLNRSRVISIHQELLARRDEERFRAIFESSGVGNLAIDESGRVLIANSAAEEMFGFDRGRLERQAFKELIADNGQKLWAELKQKIFSGRDEYVVCNEIHGRRSSGEDFPLRLSAAPMSQIGGCRDRIINIIDLSELYRLQRELHQSQRLKSIGLLTGGIAHDFNNILQVILFEATAARTEKLTGADLDQSLEAVILASDRASVLIQHLLSFSQRQAKTDKHADLNVVCARALEMLERTFESSIEIKFCPSKRSAIAKIDVGMVERVITNLCINARDAMPDGGTLCVSVSIDPSGLDDASPNCAKQICLKFADTGIGMDEATMQQAFEPFFTTKSQIGGSGLGLSAVHGIINQLGGSISVESTPGAGATFSVFLPAVTDEFPEEQDPQDEIDGGNGEVILVAEDDELVLKTIERTLEKAGYRVISAENGELAVDCFRRKSGEIDLLLFDVVMPVLSGPDAYQEIHAMDSRIPIVFMSGYDQGKLDEDIRSSDTQFVMKPFQPSQLLDTVRNALGGVPRPGSNRTSSINPA